jgi:hypothetical protein
VGNTVVLIVLGIFLLLINAGIYKLSKNFHFAGQAILGFLFLALSIYGLLFLYALVGVVRGGLGGDSGELAPMTWLDFLQNAYLFTFMTIPFFIFGLLMFIRGMQRCLSRKARNTTYAVVLSIPIVYVLLSMSITTKREEAFALAHVGDTEFTLVQKFGAMPTYSVKNCDKECVKIIWFDNPLVIDNTKWIFHINESGLVIKKLQ